METHLILLAQALEKSRSSSTHERLKNLLEEHEGKPLEDFLSIEEKQDMLRVDHDVRNVIDASMYYQKGESDDRVNELAKVIFTMTEYLRNGLSNGDVKAILIFLGVNCYMKIDIEKLLSIEELDDFNTILLSEKIVELLKSIQLGTEVPPDAPYYQKEMMGEFQYGFLNNDIAKTYRFVESVERGNRGFHFNFLLEEFILFLFHINFSCFIKALSHLQNPTEFIFYLQSLKNEDLLKIANEPSLSNKWLNLEIIRQIVDKEDKTAINGSELEALKTMLNRIGINDFGFLKQAVFHFTTSRLFNASLGALMISMDNTQIEEILSLLPINEYSFHLGARDSLRDYFVKSASDEQFDFVLHFIFKKWRTYFDQLYLAEDFYLNALLLTDFVNFVVDYHTKLTEESDLIRLIKDLIEKIKFIESEWAISYSQQKTKFHLYHSELFMLSFAYKDKKLNHPQIATKYNELIKDKILCPQNVSEETQRRLEEAKINFNWIQGGQLI